jgi:hypothetical protein
MLQPKMHQTGWDQVLLPGKKVARFGEMNKPSDSVLMRKAHGGLESS